ncbi:MAG: YncE family protein [Terriglobales bacterium]
MNICRIARVTAVLCLMGICLDCGDYYRPVANPIIPNPPNPSESHVALVITGNGDNNPGASTTIDVSGDAAISQTEVGLVPVHAALVQRGTLVYVANSHEDTVSEFSPSSPAPVITISLPAGSAPSFVASTESATVYVANSGSGTVAAISISSNVLTNTIRVGVNPVTMAELPNGQKLYVANKGSGGGNGSVSSINTIDQIPNPPVPGTWISPVWVVVRSDGQRAYVLDSGTGNVSAIDTSTDNLISTVAVGVGADFMLYDPRLERLYVTNPSANQVMVLDASSDSLAVTPVAVANPVAVAALLDGTRAYVASAALTATANGNVVSSQVTVLNATDLSVKTTIPLTKVKSAPGCASKTWSELFMASAADSTRVYIGNCDAGNTAIIQTSDDTLVAQLPSPLSSQKPATNGGTPPPQNPVFVLAGP